MAEILNITPSAVNRASSNSKTAWETDDFRTGYAGGNQWRGRIDIPLGAFSGVSTKLVVKVTVDGTSQPGTTVGYLSATPLTPNMVMSDSKVYNGDTGYQNGPHADLEAATIAESYAYSNEAGTTRVGDSSNVSSGQTFYFVFNTSALKANTTYYVYGLRNSTSTTGAGFTRAPLGGITVTLTYDASYTVTERHYLKDAEGKLTQFDSTITKAVDVGGSYTPDIKTPPKDYTTKGIRFTAYSMDWNRVGSGVPGVDYITVNENLTVEVYYPYAPPGSYVYYKDNGTVVKCAVYRNYDGVTTRCDIYYNHDGSAVKV